MAQPPGAFLAPPPGTAGALASIPSPGFSRIGPFTMYGLMIALGVIAAVWLARRRWAERGGDPDDITSVALWAVPAGLIGARLYHVITDNQLYRGHWIDALKINQGGLGIPGGIVAGVGVGVYVAHRRGMRIAPGLDVVAPALPLAQAIGRWGNWFNQELFGRPTDLPWGLRVDDDIAARAGFAPGTTFHPTFLYESLWNFALVGFLLWLDKRRVLRPGRLFAVYIGGYFLGRLWVESLRADEANTILGLRINIWISLLAITGSALVLVLGGVRRRPDDSDEPYREGFGPADGEQAEGPVDAGPADAAPAPDDDAPSLDDEPSLDTAPDRPSPGS